MGSPVSGRRGSLPSDPYDVTSRQSSLERTPAIASINLAIRPDGRPLALSTDASNSADNGILPSVRPAASTQGQIASNNVARCAPPAVSWVFLIEVIRAE